LRNWERFLNEPFDPWTNRVGDDLVLRASSLDALTSAEAARDRALALVDELNGIMAVVAGSKPVRFAGVKSRRVRRGGVPSRVRGCCAFLTYCYSSRHRLPSARLRVRERVYATGMTVGQRGILVSLGYRARCYRVLRTAEWARAAVPWYH
jgi:hypothetical protein